MERKRRVVPKPQPKPASDAKVVKETGVANQETKTVDANPPELDAGSIITIKPVDAHAELASVKQATPVEQPALQVKLTLEATADNTQVSKINEQKVVYVLHTVTFFDEVRGHSEPVIIDTSPQESLMYQEACKRMLLDMKARFGEPRKLARDDDLDDPKVQLNQKVVSAFDCYRNEERITDGANKGKLKLPWSDRFRRIESIYDVLRPQAVHQNQTGTYYYVTKSPFTVKKT